MINGTKKDTDGGAMSALHVSYKKVYVWSYRNRSKTEITANKKNKTRKKPERYTDLSFIVNIKGALLSIK
jgi:hypothetical protein